MDYIHLCVNILTWRECNDTFTYTLYDKYKIHLTPAHILSTSCGYLLGILRRVYFFAEFYRIKQNKIKWGHISLEYIKSVPFFLTLRGRGYSGPLHLIFFQIVCRYLSTFCGYLSTTYPQEYGPMWIKNSQFVLLNTQ
jgi:hypothetical protein